MIANVVLVGLIAAIIVSVGALIREYLGLYAEPDVPSEPVDPARALFHGIQANIDRQQEERRQASLGLFGYHAVEAYPPVFSRGTDGRAYWAKGDPYVWIDPFEGASNYG